MAPGQVIDAHRSCIAPCISNRDTCVPRQRSMQVRDDDDSGRSRRRRCTRLRQFPSKCRRMCSCVRRRHCRNYSLRPPGPSERCLASTPYLEPAELSPPLRPISLSFSLLLSLSFSLIRSPCSPRSLPLSCLPFSLSGTFAPTFCSLSLVRPAWNPANQPDQPPAHPLCLTRRHSPPVSTISLFLSLFLSTPTFSSRSDAGMRGCSLAGDYSSHVILYIRRPDAPRRTAYANYIRWKPIDRMETPPPSLNREGARFFPRLL